MAKAVKAKQEKRQLWIAAGVLLFGLVFAGWWFSRPEPVVEEPAKPQVAKSGSEQAAEHLAAAQKSREAGDGKAEEESLRAALALEPGFMDARLQLAQLLDRQGRILEAVENYELFLFPDGGAVRRPDDLVHKRYEGLCKQIGRIPRTDG